MTEVADRRHVELNARSGSLWDRRITDVRLLDEGLAQPGVRKVYGTDHHVSLHTRLATSGHSRRPDVKHAVLDGAVSLRKVPCCHGKRTWTPEDLEKLHLA